MPDVEWVVAENAKHAKGDRNKFEFVKGKINLLPSFISRAGISDSPLYLPGVLFDEMHSVCFLDMLKIIVKRGSIRLSENVEDRKPLAVVFDNSPGYTGIQPALDEWLTDLGPKRAKFLFVSSADKQDLKGSVDSIERTRKAITVKALLAIAFGRALREPKKFSLTKNIFKTPFFHRLAESIPDEAPCVKWLEAEKEKEFPEDSCVNHCSKRCDFVHYIAHARDEKRLDKSYGKFLGLIGNKVLPVVGASEKEIFTISLESLKNASKATRSIFPVVMPYDQILAAGFYLNTLEELPNRKIIQDKIPSLENTKGVLNSRR